MPPMRLSALLAIVGFSFACACFQSPSFKSVESQLDLRVLPDGEGIAVLYVERGLCGAPSNAGAVAALGSLLRGKRTFPPAGGWLSFDFDEEQKELEDSAARRGDEAYREFLGATRVEQAGLFEDENGRVSLFQLWRFAKPEHIFDWINEQKNKDLLEKASSGKPFEPSFPLLDPASWDRAVAWAREDGKWVRLDGDTILIDLPITRECAMKSCQEVLQVKDLRESFAPILLAASSLEIGDERTRLRFSGEASGWFRSIRWTHSGEYDPGLHEALKVARIPVGPAPKLSDMERILKVDPGTSVRAR